jgi:hypothetical protein
VLDALAGILLTDLFLFRLGATRNFRESRTCGQPFAGAFFCGFALAYARSWRLALAMSSILPCIAITGAIMNKVVSTSMR